MPNHSDYQQLPQTDDIGHDEDGEDEQPQPNGGGEVSHDVRLRQPSGPSPASSSSNAQPSRHRSLSTSTWKRGSGSGGGMRPPKIDLSTLDSAFKRWTTEITQRVRRKKRSDLEEYKERKKEIVFSVFQVVTKESEGGETTAAQVKTLDDRPPTTKKDFEALTTSVMAAILDGVHPKMITKGSSGSYFARSKAEPGRSHPTVGVFKPKDEEYGQLNPKTTKWIHRNFFWWVGWGRACLIPNLSYISEAAASLLDERLALQLVPRTELVSLSSSAFSYGWIDRNAAKKGKPLPEKVGSFQMFMNGYQDASAFLREHPWPGRAISDTYDESSHRTGTTWKRCSAALGIICGRVAGMEDDYEEDQEASFDNFDDTTSRQFTWTPALQQEFREELEKLIILDYLMRNTDRGMDNFMIKYCEGKSQRGVVDVAPGISPAPHLPAMSEVGNPQFSARIPPPRSYTHSPQPPSCSSSYTDRPHIHIAAIDNSLSFPHQHPKGWRSFVYGWLYLPISLIGRPFSEKTRKHFLPLLSDPSWWSETTFQLRKLHKVDPDFNDRMFQRQMAVMKGQGWNIVQCLKHADEGPLELTRRTKVMVWDEEVKVPVDATPEELMECISAAHSKLDSTQGDLIVDSKPLPPPTPTSASMPGSPQPQRNSRRTRSYSAGGAADSFFPPISAMSPSRSPMQLNRPVPLSTKSFHAGVSSAATGVSVLEHLERLDEVEHGLEKAMGAPRSPAPTEVVFEALDEEAEEQEEGPENLPPPKSNAPDHSPRQTRLSGEMSPTPASSSHHTRWSSQPGNPGSSGRGRRSFDLPGNRPPPESADGLTITVVPRGPIGSAKNPRSRRKRETRVVIAERLETVDARPIFSGW